MEKPHLKIFLIIEEIVATKIPKIFLRIETLSFFFLNVR